MTPRPGSKNRILLAEKKTPSNRAGNFPASGNSPLAANAKSIRDDEIRRANPRNKPFLSHKDTGPRQGLGSGRRAIPMEIVGPAFPAPHLVVETAWAFIRNGDVKYTPSAGPADMAKGPLRPIMKRPGRRDMDYAGPPGGLSSSLGLVLGKGKRIGHADAGYPGHPNLIRIFGGTPSRIQAIETADLQRAVELLRSIWDDRNDRDCDRISSQPGRFHPGS